MMSLRNLVAIIFLGIVATFFVFSVLMIHPFGNPNMREGETVTTDMDDHIIGGVNETTGEPYGAQTETGADR